MIDTKKSVGRPRTLIGDDLLNKIIEEYNKTDIAVPDLARKHGIKISTLYRRFKDRNVFLHKSGWNDNWKGYTYSKQSGNKKSRIRYRRQNIELLLLEQKHQCAICGKTINEKTARLDHCHTQNKFRSLLCNSCNVGIGLFCEDVELLKNAIKYIRAHKKGSRLF